MCMRRSLFALLIAVFVAAAVAAPAGAASTGAAWHSYALYNGKTAVEGGSGTHSSRLTRMLLPDRWSPKVNKAKTRISFGPVGTCHSTGTIAPALVASTATTSAAVLAEQIKGGTTYGSGTNGPASYRVAKFSGGALKAAYVGPTRLAGVWVVIRATTTPHGTCHIGGVRESLGFPLADAFATIHANGY